MKRLGILLVLFVLCLTASAFAETAAEKAPNAQFLFVQSASTGSFDGKQLRLNGAGKTIFFSDRPYRINGHAKTSHFVESWNKGADSFKADPPNATLSVFDEDTVKNAVIELLNPVLEGNTITYDVKIPEAFEEASLFIYDTGWGVTGGLLSGMLLGKVMNSGSQQAPAQPQYGQNPNYYYRQARPAPCQ
jgi:hypothetical protein